MNEFAAAYEAARLDLQAAGKVGRDARIDALVKQGRTVVVSYATVYCPHTDAIAGQRVRYIDDKQDRSEAVAMANDLNERFAGDGEFGYRVEPIHAPRPALDPAPDEDIPF